MICLFDSDVVKKLAICDLLDEAMESLASTPGEAFVLPTARYVLLKPIKNPEKAKTRLGEGVYDRLSNFFAMVQTLNVQPSLEEQRLLEDIVGIDPGEAVLFSASAHFEAFLLATGDKNSLLALASNAACQGICERLKANVVCFEQIILRTIDAIGFEPVREKVVPGSGCDTALAAVFGSGLEATEPNVRHGLASYIAHLRRTTGSLLVP